MKFIRRLALSAILFLGSVGLTFGAQNSIVMPLSGPLTMANVMTILNSGLVSLASTWSGPTPPAGGPGGAAVVYQFWLDTSTSPNVLRMDDGNGSWVQIGSLNTSTHAFTFPTSQPVNPQSGTAYTFLDSNKSQFISQTNASPSAYTLPQAGASGQFASGWFVDVKNTGAGLETITPTVSTIAGSPTLPLKQGRGARILSDGTNYQAFGYAPLADTGTGAMVLAIAPDIVGGTHTAITGLGIRSTGAAFDLQLRSTEALTANRALTLTLNDAARTLNLAGNLTLAGAFTTSGAFGLTFTLSGTTNATLPAGTHTLAALDVSQLWPAGQIFTKNGFALSGLTSGQVAINCADVCSGTLTLPAGTTDFSATGGASQVVKQTTAGGPFTVGQLSVTDIASGAALTKTDDTNVTLTLGGTPASALLKSTSLTLGWTGTLAAARLNSNVVQAFTNDTNITATITAQNATLGFTGTLAAGRLNANVVQGVTADTNISGTISAQNLTFAWVGTLAAARLNANVVQAFTNDTNITASITAQNATFAWAGQLSIARGGSSQSTALAARGSSGFNIEGATSHGDSNYTIVATDRTVYHTALSAARTDTLPAASALNPGQMLIVNDFRGVATAVNTITLAAAGADTINGGSTLVGINAQYGAAILYSDGVSRWTFFPGSVGGGGVTSIGGTGGAIALGNGMVISGSVLSPGTSTPLLWQAQAGSCNSGHQVWYIDQNFCANWAQSFVTNNDPSVIVAIPVTGTVTVGALSQLTFTFGAGACASGCSAAYTFVAPSITASMASNVMTVTAGSGLLIGQAITGTGVTSTTITGNLLLGSTCGGSACTGNGGAGTYLIANSQTVTSRSMTATDTLNSVAWGLSNAIKANTNLYNASATTTAQQKQIIWSTANTPAPQISLDIDGRVPLNIAPFGTGSVSTTPPNTCASSFCALNMDVGPSIQYSRNPGFVAAQGSNIYQALFTSPATGGTGVYGQISVSIVNNATSLGSVFLSGQWASGITAGVYVSQGLYSISNGDNGADTATFNKYFGAALHLTGSDVTLPGLNGGAGVRSLCFDNSTGAVTFNNGACGTSDARLKQVTSPLSRSQGSSVLSLTPVNFKWLDSDNDRLSGPQIGFLAQDVERLFPEVVTTNETPRTITLADGSKRTIENVKSVDYGKLVVPVISEMQELARDQMIRNILFILMIVGLAIWCVVLLHRIRKLEAA